jgi:hypothetical protein
VGTIGWVSLPKPQGAYRFSRYEQRFPRRWVDALDRAGFDTTFTALSTRPMARTRNGSAWHAPTCKAVRAPLCRTSHPDTCACPADGVTVAARSFGDLDGDFHAACTRWFAPTDRSDHLERAAAIAGVIEDVAALEAGCTRHAARRAAELAGARSALEEILDELGQAEPAGRLLGRIDNLVAPGRCTRLDSWAVRLLGRQPPARSARLGRLPAGEGARRHLLAAWRLWTGALIEGAGRDEAAELATAASFEWTAVRTTWEADLDEVIAAGRVEILAGVRVVKATDRLAQQALTAFGARPVGGGPVWPGALNRPALLSVAEVVADALHAEGCPVIVFGPAVSDAAEAVAALWDATDDRSCYDAALAVTASAGRR